MPPIVGTEQQAKDLIAYIGESASRGESIWETNIFGKSIEQLVQDGIRSKLASISEESQAKLQDTMQKIVNDSKGGLVCILYDQNPRSQKGSVLFRAAAFLCGSFTWKKYLLPSMLFFPACKKLQLFLVGKLLGIRIVSRSPDSRKVSKPVMQKTK